MKQFKIYLLNIFIVIFCIFCVEIKANAEIGDNEGLALTTYPIPGANFDDHVGIYPHLQQTGNPLFCVQRGYPFRSAVSDMQMRRVSIDHGWVDDHFELNEDGNLVLVPGYQDISEGKLTHAAKELNDWDDKPIAVWAIWRGWGIWEMNGDATDAIQIDNSHAPSSDERHEEFTRYKNPDESVPDDENNRFLDRYPSGAIWGGNIIPIKRFRKEVRILSGDIDGSWESDSLMTGHEGVKPTYNVKLKRITYTEAGYNPLRIYAMGIMHYYVYEDPASSGYTDIVKYRVCQAFTWAAEKNKMTVLGLTGDAVRVIFSGNVDADIGVLIGSKYEDMKLYRQVVWKLTNMRMIPSFASKKPETAEPIKLYWDANANGGSGAYTATIVDANGVLDYFDFNIPGCNVSKNGDGTITITASGQVNTLSYPSQSKLEPVDGVFKLPLFLRWIHEGQTKTFQYSMLTGRGNWIAPTWQYHESNEGNGPGKEYEKLYGDFEHRHDYSPACNWFCADYKRTEISAENHALFKSNRFSNPTAFYNNCDEEYNCGITPHTHSNNCETENECHHSDEEKTWVEELGIYVCYQNHGTHRTCGFDYEHTHSSDCHDHEKEADLCHDCNFSIRCQHQWTCPYYTYKRNYGPNEYINSMPLYECHVVWCCYKEHWQVTTGEIEAVAVDWQDVIEYADGTKIIDPEICYIRVETVPHEYPAETDTEILLIADNDEWNDLTYVTANGKTIRHSSHLRVGEKFHLKYIYSYKGASKGFRIEFSANNKPYYQYNYLSRMESPNNNIPIYKLKPGFFSSNWSVPHAVLIQDLTDITIKGLYNTPETAYTLNSTYSWDSSTRWNDRVYLDALVTDQYDDNYNNKSASSITSNCSASELTDFSVTKPSDNNMIVVWEFDAPAEVFSSAMVYATSFIEVGSNKNYTRSYFDEAYNYAKDGTWNYDVNTLGDHNHVGGVGYFSSGQSGESVPRHAVYTQNNESKTHAIRNKVWQSDVDIKVSKFVQNTGAGITEQIYQERGRNTHDMNYNLYYTIEVENPKATIFADKQRYANHRDLAGEQTTAPYDTRNDVYEFDVNNLISWGSTGASQTGASYGTTTVVDHIKTGTTYIQREIPTVLATMTSSPKETMTFSIYPNHDRLIYEDYYTNAIIEGVGLNRKVKATAKDTLYPTNKKTATSDIWPAMNPNYVEMQPQNIRNSNNVPDKDHQSDNVLQHTGMTSFSIELSNGQTKTVTDGNVKNYTQYDFEYNKNNRNNKVAFPSYRRSIMFFKYSKTNYSYNGNNIQSAVGDFRDNAKTQKESYYISQVLFKSNYTTKYMKELEHQGADYIKDYDSRGNMTDAWIDMVNQNKFAIVSAGQGFELRVTLKYENSYLTQYLSRYFGVDDGQNDALGTSNRINKNYLPSATETNRQFANISALTGKDGRSAPYYKDTERAYISGNSVLDRLAVNLVTGSNVFNDLYVFMSDNPDTVYSYSGIYDTPVIFNRSIKYSEDFSVTTVTYTMCVSHENGIASNLQNMKFYTNQLAPDKRTPGIVEGTRDVSDSGEHSITIWTPIIAATPVTYPNLEQENWNTTTERYIGDAIELGYTIKTTGADDAIVHIVQ